MREFQAYVRDIMEVKDFLIQYRFKKGVQALEESFTEKQAMQLISAGYGVQDEYMRHPGANAMTLFKRSRLELCLSHEGLAQAVTEEWGRESARIHKEQCAQAREKWLATLRPEQLCEARMGNLLPPGIKRPRIVRFTETDIRGFEAGTITREQTSPDYIQPLESFFGQLYEDLVRPVKEGANKDAVATKQDENKGPEKIASLGAYRNDVLLVVDCLLRRKQGDTAKVLMSLPDPIQQQLVGAAFSLHAYRARYGWGPHICLMKKRRLELGLTCDEMAKKIEDHYRTHSSEMFKQQQGEFIERWIERVKPHRVEIQAVRQGSMIPHGMPQRMIIHPITGGDIARMETNRPHREEIGETVRPYETYWGEIWEDLCKLIPIPAPEEEKNESADTEKQAAITAAPATVKTSKAQGNVAGKAKAPDEDATSAPSQATIAPAVATPPVVSPETTTTTEVAANGV